MLKSTQEGSETMIGHEDNEEVTFKVSDRRKYNPDGSLKDGVELTPEPVVEKTIEAEPDAEIRLVPEEDLAAPLGIETPEPETEDESFDEEELPGAEDPASFVNFLSTLATNAAAALGAVPHPATGQRSLDLDTGKYWLMCWA